jgi:Bles03-like protein
LEKDVPDKSHAIRRKAQIVEGDPFSASLPYDSSVRSWWIFAQRAVDSSYPPDGEKSGKWLIFAAEEIVNKLWVKIRTAIEAGRLGNLAIVASIRKARKDPRSGARKHVICVYTYDWTEFP